MALVSLLRVGADDPRTRNLEPGTWNLEPGTWNLELGTWNLELGTWNLELGTPLSRPSFLPIRSNRQDEAGLESAVPSMSEPLERGPAVLLAGSGDLRD